MKRCPGDYVVPFGYQLTWLIDEMHSKFLQNPWNALKLKLFGVNGKLREYKKPIKAILLLNQ